MSYDLLSFTKNNQVLKPIFTIHAGEYLVGEELEKRLKDWDIWIPSKDIGIDLLIRNKKTNQIKSIQVKFSKDFVDSNSYPPSITTFRNKGWFYLDSKKIQNSIADFWIFALYSFSSKEADYLIFKKIELINLFNSLNRFKSKKFNCYIWTLNNDEAFEGRSIGGEKNIVALLNGGYTNTNRDISSHLNNWNKLRI